MLKNLIIALLLVILSAVLYIQWYKEGFVFSGVGDYRHFEQESYWLATHRDKPGFAFFSQDSGLVAQVTDSNEDGVVDLLIYSAFDSQLQHRVQYEDYGMNGVMNFRTITPIENTKGAWFEIFHLGAWSKLEGKAPNLHIKVGGKELPVVADDLGFLIVKTHNKVLK